MDFPKHTLFGLLFIFVHSCSDKTASDDRRVSNDSISVLLAKSISLPDSLNERAYDYAEQALKLAQLNPDYPNMFGVLYNMGVQAERIGNYDLSNTVFLEAIKYSDKKNLPETGNVCNYIAQIAFRQGKNSVALDYFLEALSIRKQLNDKEGQASSHLNIGSVYQKENKFDPAEKEYLLSLRIYSDLSNKTGKADCFNNLGGLFLEQNMPEKALEFYHQAEDIYREQVQTEQLFTVLGNIALVYSRMGNTDEARKYYGKTLRVARSLPLAQPATAQVYCKIGMFYDEQNEADSAMFYFNNAVDIASASNLYEVLANVLEERSRLYARKNQYREAYHDYVAHCHVNDIIDNKETAKAFVQKSMQYEFDIRQQAQLYRDKMQRIFIIALTMVALFICILAINNYRNFIQKKKANILLAKQQEEITDSIRYASLIQRSTLPSKEYVDNILPEHFIFFRPRDIVSGDFYWVTQRGDMTIIAVADCTGHGVPGAIISMLGISSLNEIVSKMETPKADEILNRLRDEIIRLLNPEGCTATVKDGMDIALVIIDKEKNELEYAGAYNPFYLIRNNALIETKADKMPIGVFAKNEKPFTATRLPYRENDTIYLFSDGYADQFGEDSGKKFKIKNFKELLLDINEKPMAEQCRILGENHLGWRGNFSQVDDILVVGIKL